MDPYSLTVCANLTRDRLEVEVQRNNPGGLPEELALVFKTSEGWGIDYADDTFADRRDAAFDAVVVRAKELLEEYKDRHDEEPPDGLTATGMAVWLLEDDVDGE